MKTIKLLILKNIPKVSSTLTGVSIILYLFFSSTSCKEVGPFIDLEESPIDTTLTDTTYLTTTIEQPQLKTVLLEDFTGVRCVNCPEGHQMAAQLVQNNPDRVIAVSIHSGIFAHPYPFSHYDFKIPEGELIEQAIGPVSGYPSGAIDRYRFSGENTTVVTVNKWTNYVNTRLSSGIPANIHIEKDYDNATRKLSVKVTLHYLVNTTDEHRLSIMITESNMIDPQLTPQGIDTFYVHNHVLRDMLTPYNGIRLNASLEPGRVFIKEFRYQLPPDFNADNCYIVAFIHRWDSGFEVFHAEELPVN